MPSSKLFTVPNLISSSRVALAMGFFAFDGPSSRVALIGVASLTDFLDGWLARRTKVTSRFGALLDPIADRFFVVSVVTAFVLGGQIGAWQAIAILFRDVMSVIGFFVARNVSWLRAIAFKARPLGKAVTVAQMLAFVTVLLAPAHAWPIVLLVAVLGLAATVDYTLMLWRERTQRPE